MTEKANEKEIYRLWWEYLKRSEKYRKFCEKFNQFCEKEKLSITASDRSLISFYVLSQLETGKLPKKLKEFAESRCYPNLVNFGDVFNDSFEEWFEMHKKMHKKMLNVRENVFPPVRSYSKCFEEDFSRCIEDFVHKNRRSPTLDEFKDAFKHYLESAKMTITLQINVGERYTDNELIKKCASFIKESREQPKSASFDIEALMKIGSVPMSRVKLDILKRYLRVYDLRSEGKKIHEIIKIMGDKYVTEKNEFPAYESIIPRDFSEAKKIIKNVERGVFPRFPNR